MKKTVLLSGLLFLSLSTTHAQQPLDTLALRAKADSLHNVGALLYSSKSIEKCIDVNIEEVDILSKVFDNTPSMLPALNNLSSCLCLAEMYSNAIPYLKKSIAIMEGNVLTNNVNYANALRNTGYCYEMVDSTLQALYYYEKECQSLRQIYGPKDELYLSRFINYFLYLSSMVEGEDAIWCYKNALNISNFPPIQSLEIMESIAEEYHMAHQYSEAIQYYEIIANALSKCIECQNSYHSLHIRILFSMGECFEDLQNYNKAIEAYSLALTIFDSNTDIFDEEIYDLRPFLYSNIGNCFVNLGEFNKAIDCFEEMKRNYGDSPEVVHHYYNNCGIVFLKLGEYKRALDLFMSDVDYCYLSDEDRAMNLNNIGLCNKGMGRFLDALDYFMNASEITSSNGRAHIFDLAMYNSNIADCYFQVGDYENAIEYSMRSAELYKNLIENTHTGYYQYAGLLNNLGLVFYSQEKYLDAIDCLMKSLRIKNTFGDLDNIDNLDNYYNLYLCNIKINNIDSAIYFTEKYISSLTNYITNQFSTAGRLIRELFWARFSNKFNTLISGFYSYSQASSNSMAICYDGLLLSKGLLLNAETELRNLILDSNNPELLDLYDRFSLEKHQLARQLEKPIADRTMPTDSLEAVCDKLESELMKKSKAFGDYTKNLAIKWTDVQAKLGKKDIAIEFIEVPVSEDTTKYCALTLKNGYDAPHFVELFDLKDLQALNAKYASRLNSDGLIYGDPELYNLVWKPLKDELKGVDNIYFGPSGELYQIAIEYATDGKKTMAEKKNVYRLSSTRQLVLIKDKGELKSSSIYGGFKYGASMETLLADSRNYTATSTRSADPFFNVDSLNIRGASSSNFGVNDLPGTLKEATTISGLMDKAHFENTLTVGEAGTEAAFKSISGQRRNILHIATHGFYWTKSEAERIAERLDRREMMMSGNDTRRVKEDAALTRSGLLFSGANNALKKGYEKQDGVEDGILTAKEIAQIDLRGTDLLVLSACQTGLGEVSGEGVFGLQRGFKKAGVNSILMSLWEVDDDATQLLMTTFYKNLTSGKSKTESLKLAQEKVRKTPGFESPYYWAAFILLDGID